MDKMERHSKDDGQTYSLKQELAMAIELAQKAGKVIQSIRAKGYKIQDKGENLGPVTEADQAVSEMLLREIAQIFPEDLIISEEAALPQGVPQANRIWFIDPIDGTKDFIAGRNEWSIMLGLAIHGNPCLGVVYQPDLDQLYYARKGKGAFSRTSDRTEIMKVRAVPDLREAVLLQSHSHWSPKANQLAKQIGISKILKQGSIGLKFGKIAEGKGDLYFNFSGHCHLWDLCGPEAILQEAGGGVILSSGKPLIYRLGETVIRSNFLAANKDLLEKLYHFLK